MDERRCLGEHRKEDQMQKPEEVLVLALWGTVSLPWSGRRLAEMELGRFVGCEKNRDLEGDFCSTLPHFPMK